MNLSKKSFLAVLLAIPMALSSLPASAAGSAQYEDPAVISENSADTDVYSIVRLTDGNIRVISGAPGQRLLTDHPDNNEIDEYVVCIDGEKLLSASIVPDTVQEKQNSYYSISFVLPQTNSQVFITGLSAEALVSIQNQILDSYIKGEELIVSHLDIIDTEKTDAEDSDDYLCWAAASSNILHYTGWGSLAGYETEDDIFDEFSLWFYQGGNEAGAFRWFFNGVYDYNSIHNEIYCNGGGGYLNDYANDQLYNYYPFDIETFNDPTAQLETVFEKLRNGWGVTMSIFDNNYAGGHAVSLWGYIIDNDYPESDKQHYEALIFSDSDSAMPQSDDRRDAFNDLYVQYLKPCNNGIYDSWIMEDYHHFVISGFTVLMPYDESIQKETDPKATKNKQTTIDFCIRDIEAFIEDSSIIISSDFEPVTKYPKMKTFDESDSIFLFPIVQNASQVDYNGDVTYKVTILDEDGNKVAEKTRTVSLDHTYAYELTSGIRTDGVQFDNLSAGNYQAVFELNPDREIIEAYYTDNTYTFDFSVVSERTDPSDAYIKVSVPEPDWDKNDFIAGLTYGPFDSITYNRTQLWVSYYSKGKWTDWRKPELAESDIQKNFPEKAFLQADGTMVKYAMLLYSGNDISGFVCSEPQRIKIPLLAAEPSEDNPKAFSAVGYNSEFLADGEEFVFNIINYSDESISTAKGKYYFTFQTPLGESVSTKPKRFAMSSDEKELTIRADNWYLYDNSAPLSGRCPVTLTVKTLVNEHTTHIDSIYLGIVPFEELPSSVVTTGEDVVDSSDGLTSLREAYEYCRSHPEEESTITFAENMRDSSVSLKTPLKINIPLTIDGEFHNREIFEDEYNPTFGINFSCYTNEHYVLTGENTFIVTSKGELNLNGLTFNYTGGTKGVFVRNNGGKVNISNCLMGGCDVVNEGGAIYTNGGTVKIRDSTFKSCSADYGSALYMTGNAQVDIINTLFIESSSFSSIIENDDGKLSIVYSSFVSCQQYSFMEDVDPREWHPYIIHSNGETSVVGCILTNYMYDGMIESVGGNVSVFASTLENAPEKYYSENGNKKACESDIYKVNKYDSYVKYDYEMPDEYGFSNVIHFIPVLKDKTKVNIVSVDGELQYTTDGKKYIKTGIKAAFDSEEYDRDALGNTRINYPSQGFLRGKYQKMPPAPHDTQKTDDTDKDDTDKDDTDKDDTDKDDTDKDDTKKDDTKKDDTKKDDSEKTSVIAYDGIPDTGNTNDLARGFMAIAFGALAVLAVTAVTKKKHS